MSCSAWGFPLRVRSYAWQRPIFWVLLVGRILQAVSTGILLPFMTTIAMVSFLRVVRPPPWASQVAMGFAPNIGPTVGGAMASAWGLAQLLRSSGGSDLRVDAVRPGAGEALEAA